MRNSSEAESSIYSSKKVIQHTQLLLNSYQHWKHQPLINSETDPEILAKKLFLAPFVVLSHNGAEDPILNYGNEAALELWGMTWDSFIHTPSRLTAEPIYREERKGILSALSQKGLYENYAGIRISSAGRRFRIEGVCLWNLINDKNETCGQAAMFKDWTFLDLA